MKIRCDSKFPEVRPNDLRENEHCAETPGEGATGELPNDAPSKGSGNDSFGCLSKQNSAQCDISIPLGLSQVYAGRQGAFYIARLYV